MKETLSNEFQHAKKTLSQQLLHDDVEAVVVVVVFKIVNEDLIKILKQMKVLFLRTKIV